MAAAWQDPAITQASTNLNTYAFHALTGQNTSHRRKPLVRDPSRDRQRLNHSPGHTVGFHTKQPHEQLQAGTNDSQVSGQVTEPHLHSRYILT